MTTILRRVVAALCAALAASAHASTYTDVWFDPQQPGWGVNVVQQLETAFVTLFVYGPDGKPTWYVASDAQVTAYSSPGGFPVFHGTLFRTEGSWHGAPYDAGRSATNAVGSIDLEVLAKDRMRVHYTAEGVSGVKEVTRFSFAQPIELSNYVAQFMLRQAVGGAPFGTLYVQADMLVHFDGTTGQGFARVDDQLGRRCEYRGPYQQAGKLLRFAGTYTCNAGDAPTGTFEIADVEVTANGLTGYLRASSGSHTQYGRFAAVLR